MLTTTEVPTYAAIYARVSSDAQDVNNSIKAQVAECTRYAKDNNIVVVETFIDEAESGLKSSRPQFQRMLEIATSNQKNFSTILVWKFSRFSRNKYDNALFKNRLRKKGVRLISIKEPTDDSPAGKLIESTIENIDAFYSDNLSEEVRRGKRQLVYRGFYPGSKAPYGLKIVKVKEDNGSVFHNKFELDPPYDKIVRRIFLDAIAGRSLEEIRAGLNSDNIPTPRGGKNWAASTILTMINNPHYAGYISWGPKTKSNDEPLLVPDCHPAIVSKEELEQARRILASKAKAVANPRQTGSEHMMSGLLKCRLCGAKLTMRPANKGRFPYYMCDTRRHDGVVTCECPNLSSKKFEPKFLEAVIDDILSPRNMKTAIKKISAELQGPYKEQNAALEAIDAKILDLERREERVMTAYEDSTYTANDYISRITPLRNSKAALKEKRIEANTALGNDSIIASNPREVIAFAKNISGLIQHSSPKERKQVLRRFIECVWIEPGKATIVYRIPLPSDSRTPNSNKREFALEDHQVPPSAHSTPPTRG